MEEILEINKSKIVFKDTDIKYVEDALSLALEEYKEQCNKTKQLLSADFKNELRDILKGLFSSQYGKVAIKDNKLIGYLGFYGPWDGHFGNVKGVYSPLGGSAFRGKDREKTASMLFQYAAKDMVMDDVYSVALTRFADDKEVGTSFVLNGFGIRCSDAVMELSKRHVIYHKDLDISFEELKGNDRNKVNDLKLALKKHLCSSPVFFSLNLQEFDDSINQEYTSRIFVAKKENEIIGFMAIDEKAENFITEHKDMSNICGAYVLPKYRGSDVASQLLEYVCSICESEGKKYLGVDCETLNPTALRFWDKNFERYTFSYHRRIDERIGSFARNLEI